MTVTTQRRIIVTAALPYANGPLHLGHMLEHIQTDIWVRFQKSRGHECYFVCADDAHGTPIMLRAEQLGLSPEALIDEVALSHQADLRDFWIKYDNYHSTHSLENRECAEEIYRALRAGGDIAEREIEQAFDAQKQMFLPDRYVKGTCPECRTPDQYGDNCEHCGATYGPLDLIDPISVLTQTSPVRRQSTHYFFKLQNYQHALKAWFEQGQIKLQAEVWRKLSEWFDVGLKEWDISRDAPYFGFEIPDAPGKFFYVWLDAPIGYMASFKHLCKRETHLSMSDFWAKDASTELYHFIGKDIVYFHALFWPAMLHASGHRLPTEICAHGFLTVNSQKMSKSKGTFILARQYLDLCDPQCLRYYFAAKLNGNIEDLDFKLDDFTARINSDLVGKLVNIPSRLCPFIHRYFDQRLCDKLAPNPLLSHFLQQADNIAQYFEQRDFSRAVRTIMDLCDQANEYIAEQKPWALVKDPGLLSQAHEVCTLGLNLFRVLMIYLAPILPKMAEQASELLGCELSWAHLSEPLVARPIGHYQALMQRLDSKKVEKMIEVPPAAPLATPAAVSLNPAIAPVKETITMEDFSKIDLRIGRIINAEEVVGADKLVKLTVDIGQDAPRQIFAGIKHAYSLEALKGRLTLVIVNLAPRKMRFGLSEGMVLAAGPGGQDIYLLKPEGGALPGMAVK